MEGCAVDALLPTSDDILGSVKLRLRGVSWGKLMARRGRIPSEIRIEEAR